MSQKIILELSEQDFADVQSALVSCMQNYATDAPQLTASCRKILKKTWAVLRKHRAAQKKNHNTSRRRGAR